MIGGGDGVPLRERGFIGDTGTAALVAADGTIDWWCPRRFDGPATFFRLLDPEGGALRVGPAGPPRSGPQTYDPATNVLRTRLPAPEGDLEITDFMPWNGQRPSGRIVRLLTALRGRVDVEVDVIPGAGFRTARDVTTWSAGIAFNGVVVHTGCPLDGRRGQLSLEAGERAVVVAEPVGERRPETISIDEALDLLDRTTTAWRSHLAPLSYDGPFRAEVERSLLVLKGLTYGPSSALVASPTTSIPEKVGGERNWDYRYAWLRDSALAVNACRDAGLVEEADGLDGWLAKVLAGDRPPLAPLYDVDGLRLDPDAEQEMPLAGFRRSQPVRAGNACAGHLQLDFYADVVSTVDTGHRGYRRSQVGELWPQLSAMADWVADAWRHPDRGIWEIRSDPRHLVASKLACWYTLARMAELALARNPLDMDAFHWRQASREVVAWLDANGLASGGGLRADPSPADAADGSLVQVAWRNPWPGDRELVARTVDRVIDQLATGPFIYRYGPSTPDGLPSGEGAFLACSFWTVAALARLERWEEAHERMEALCRFGRPLGLLPEEAEPLSGDFLGNLPHASSHLALVQAALALSGGPR